MNLKRKSVVRGGLGLVAGVILGAGLLSNFAGSAPVPGEDANRYPNRPVKIVVPVSAGGSADKLARTVAQKLGEKWNQSVVVENQPGASSAIGNAAVAHARGDGYTLLLGGDALSLNALQPGKLSYDPLRDLRGVTKAVVNPQLLVVRPGLGVRTFQEFSGTGAAPAGRDLDGLAGRHGQPAASGGGAAERTHRRQDQPDPIPRRRAGHAGRAGRSRGRHAHHAGRGHGERAQRQAGGACRHHAIPLQGAAGRAHDPGVGIGGLRGGKLAGILRAGLHAARGGGSHPPRRGGVLREPETSALLENLGFTIAASSPEAVDQTVRDDIAAYRRVIVSADVKLK